MFLFFSLYFFGIRHCKNCPLYEAWPDFHQLKGPPDHLLLFCYWSMHHPCWPISSCVCFCGQNVRDTHLSLLLRFSKWLNTTTVETWLQSKLRCGQFPVAQLTCPTHRGRLHVSPSSNHMVPDKIFLQSVNWSHRFFTAELWHNSTSQPFRCRHSRPRQKLYGICSAVTMTDDGHRGHGAHRIAGLIKTFAHSKQQTTAGASGTINDCSG